jgi:hypothetical protein
MNDELTCGMTWNLLGAIQVQHQMLGATSSIP